MSVPRLSWVGLLGLACATPPKSSTPPSEPTASTVDSGEPTPEDDCITDERFFSDDATPLLVAECAGCHSPSGPASSTRYVLEPDAPDANWAMLTDLVDTVGPDTVLGKPTGETDHGGGLRFDRLDGRYAVLHELVARIQEPGGCAHPGEAPLTCDTPAVRPGSTPLRRLTDHQYATLVADVFGPDLPTERFPATPLGRGFRTLASNNAVSAAGAESVMLAAEDVSSALDLDGVLDCGDSAEACGRAWLLDRAEAALRRPLTTAEASLVTRFLDAGVGPEEGVRMGVFLLLQMPQVIYLDSAGGPEVVQAADDVEHDVLAVDPYAVASRLSFFLTDGPPDAELLEAAASGGLDTREGVAEQAARIVATSPRTTGVVARFHQDWLHLHQIHDIIKDPEPYPQWDDELVDELLQGTDLFTTEVVWSGEATLDALLFDTAAWVTPETAAVYGVSVEGEGWQRVDLGDARPGVLGRLGFLAAHSYAAASSPVRRGAWVLEELLCEELAPPPDVDLTLPEEGGDIETIRDKLASHAADPSCRTCHDRIDPIGFSFEHFDGIGAWRDTWESGISVDATGSLGEPTGDFDGYAEMIALVGTSDRARQCYSRRWFEYAVGRRADPGDACSLRRLASRFDDAGGDIKSLLVDIALTDAVLYRTEGGADPETQLTGDDDAAE